MSKIDSKSAERKESGQRRDQKGGEDREADLKLDAILRQILDPDAYTRISNVKMVKGSAFYRLVAQQIVMYYNKYRLKLSDTTVRKILSSVSAQIHKDYNIKFVRK